MQKRLFQHTLIITVLVLTLTGCASIQARVSSCQTLWADTFSANNRIPRQERKALLAFAEATNGGIVPAAVGQFPCKRVPSPCQWDRVVCTSGHVTVVDFSHKDISGEIPAEIGNLSQLRGLILIDNNLSGPIPLELGNLSQLEELHLVYTELSGEIPAELGNLSQLRTLHLISTQLSGPIPPELGNLSQLETLSLADNRLSGEIPAELGNLSQLRSLSLQCNQLSGEIPPEIGYLSQLEWLALNNNQLSGPIPLELDNLTRLNGIFLSSPDSAYLSDAGLCIPQTAEFEAWITGVWYYDLEGIPYCE